jgi:chitin synthase
MSVCKDGSSTSQARYRLTRSVAPIYPSHSIKTCPQVNFYTLAAQLSGQDTSDLFDTTAVPRPACAGLTAAYATANLCATNASATPNTPCPLGQPTAATFNQLRITNTTKQVGWSWEQIAAAPNYMVIDGSVLNLTPYMALHPTPIANDTVDAAIRYVLREFNPVSGRDATRIFFNRPALATAARCMVQRYRAGHIDKITAGCFASQLFLYISLFVIMSVVLARFTMAVVFNWFLSHKLVQPPKDLKGRHAVSPAVMPAGANLEVDNMTGTAPWTEKANKLSRKQQGEKTPRINEKASPSLAPPPTKGRSGAVDANGMIDMGAIGAELFCACLVTCYSEGEDSIRGTLDSISAATYSDARKLLFIVADGMITGSGEKRSTPDICVGLLDADPRFGNPTPMSYLAVASGKKAHNQALVYAGHYSAYSAPNLSGLVEDALAQRASREDERRRSSSSSVAHRTRRATRSRATEASATRRWSS